MRNDQTSDHVPAPASVAEGRMSQAAEPGTRHPHSSNHYKILAVCLFLAGTICLVYGQTVRHEFLNYDDPAYVSENHVLEKGVSLRAIVWSFTTFEAANWHPVTWLSHMLDCQLFGLRPGWHHAMNVGFHIADSILLFILFLRMTGALWRSAMVAALFALHPLHVESVVWVAERKDVLSTFFAMLAMLTYVRYVRRPSMGRYALVAILLALGLMSKPMLVTLPLVLLLLDYWPLGRWAPWQGPSQDQSSRDVERAPIARNPLELKSQTRTTCFLFVEKLPLLLLALACSAVTYIAQKREGAMEFLGDRASVPVRLANALVSYVTYLGKTVWPNRLIVFYPYEPQKQWERPVAAAILLLAFTGLALWQWRRRPYLAVGWFWYLGTLVPVIGLIQVGGQSMADRYTYIPLIGIFLLAIWGTADLAKAWRIPLAVLGAVSAAVIAACMILTARQVARWKNTETLFEYVLTVSPDNVEAHVNLGDVFLHQNRNDEAETHFREIVRLDPIRRASAQSDWGLTLSNRNRIPEAVEHFREALRLEPGLAAAHNNLGMALVQLGKTGEVIKQLQEAVRLAPDEPQALKNLAWALATCPDRRYRNGPRAVELAQKAITVSGGPTPQYFDILASAYAEAGRFPQAAAAAERALNLATAQDNPQLAQDMRARIRDYQRLSAPR